MSEPQQSSPSAEEEDRSFQFSLRTLFLVTFLWAVFFAIVSMFGLGTAIAAYVCAGWIAATAYAYYCKRFEWTPWLVGTFFAFACILWIIDTELEGYPAEHSRRTACMNNMKEIYLALAVYHSRHGTYPPAYITDESGKPMHSWRVLILPYLGYKGIYDKYNFDEPWDGPNNRKLHNIILLAFYCPSDENAVKHSYTSYTVVVGPGTMFPGAESAGVGPSGDPPGNTLLLVETTNSGIHWMEPRDLHVVQMAPGINPKTGQGISSKHPGGVNTIFADGSIRFICEEDFTPEEVQAMLSREGGEAVDFPTF